MRFLTGSIALGCAASGAAFAVVPAARARQRNAAATAVRQGVLRMASQDGDHSADAAEGMTRNGFARTAAASVAAGLLGLAMPAGPASRADAKGVGNSRLSSMASSGSRVNKDASSLLRLGLPVDCPQVRELQDAVEAAKYDIYLKNWGRAISNCQRAKVLATSKQKDLLAAVRADVKDAGSKLLTEVVALIGPLEDILESKEGTGTVAEREKLDKAYAAQNLVANKVGELEELMVPADYIKRLADNIPEEFRSLPALLGRATVEFVLEKPNKGEQFDVEGRLFDQARLVMVIDGYTAPVTGGCFVDLVQKGFYNGLKITRSDGFVVQTGDPDPEGPLDGYVPPGQKEPRVVPLEVTLRGGLPTYSETTEDAGNGAKATALPFQAYGCIGMARSEFEADSAGSQFFWLLFESDLTPAGKNLLDGRYAVLGYTIENAELLKDVKEGDVIRSARVVAGAGNLKK